MPLAVDVTEDAFSFMFTADVPGVQRSAAKVPSLCTSRFRVRVDRSSSKCASNGAAAGASTQSLRFDSVWKGNPVAEVST
jgi:hypothetical protein